MHLRMSSCCRQPLFAAEQVDAVDLLKSGEGARNHRQTKQSHLLYSVLWDAKRNDVKRLLPCLPVCFVDDASYYFDAVRSAVRVSRRASALKSDQQCLQQP